MKNILIISGHPDLKNSVANATILEEVARALPEASIRKLDALYPNAQFDIAAEQQALLAADVLVWQFPFSWYGLPGLMKLWLDQVFLHGFSHGSKAQLGGKKLLLSITAGAPPAVYKAEGAFGHPLEDYLYPLQTTAKLCNLDYQPPIYTMGVSYSARDDAQKIEAQRAAAREHAVRLVAALRQLAA